MDKLKQLLEQLESGNKVKGVVVTLNDIRELQVIYSELINNYKTVTTINSNVNSILNHCDIKTMQYGIGWKVV